MDQPISKISKTPQAKVKLLSRLHYKRPSISIRFFLGLILILVVALEAGTLYFYLYQNVQFKDKGAAPKTVSESTRINFENYEKVMKRLDEVAAYQPPSSINFSSFTSGVGRDNPFADPQ